MLSHTQHTPSEVRPAPTAPPKEITELAIGQAIRQGDVLVQRVQALPEGAVLRRRRDLAVGIRASHVAEDPASTYDVPGSDDIYIVAKGRWPLSHDEHAWFTLPPGVYRSWRQQETIGLVDAPRPEIRTVID
jgi:hypothetical protein